MLKKPNSKPQIAPTTLEKSINLQVLESNQATTDDAVLAVQAIDKDLQEHALPALKRWQRRIDASHALSATKFVG